MLILTFNWYTITDSYYLTLKFLICLNSLIDISNQVKYLETLSMNERCYTIYDRTNRSNFHSCKFRKKFPYIHKLSHSHSGVNVAFVFLSLISNDVSQFTNISAIHVQMFTRPHGAFDSQLNSANFERARERARGTNSSAGKFVWVRSVEITIKYEYFMPPSGAR